VQTLSSRHERRASGTSIERDFLLFDAGLRWSGCYERGICHGAAARGFANGTYTNDPQLVELALEWDVVSAAYDEIAWVISQQIDHLVVRHVVGDGGRRIGGRAVHDNHLMPRFERQSGAGREPPESRNDDVSKLPMHRDESVEPLLLERRLRMQVVGVDLRESQVGQTLDTKCISLDQSLPYLERLRTWKAKVTANDQLIVAPMLRLFEDRIERFDMAVNVGQTEKSHDFTGSPGQKRRRSLRR
jgi:hypothetical protein